MATNGEVRLSKKKLSRNGCTSPTAMKAATANKMFRRRHASGTEATTHISAVRGRLSPCESMSADSSTPPSANSPASAASARNGSIARARAYRRRSQYMRPR